MIYRSCWRFPKASHLPRLQADAMLRRDPGRSVQETEELALKTLETLLKTPNQFPKLCRSGVDGWFLG
jgi:hypothetical protein